MTDINNRTIILTAVESVVKKVLNLFYGPFYDDQPYMPGETFFEDSLGVTYKHRRVFFDKCDYAGEVIGVVEVRQAFHCVATEEQAKEVIKTIHSCVPAMSLYVLKCTIPAGAEYFEDESGNIATNKIKIGTIYARTDGEGNYFVI